MHKHVVAECGAKREILMHLEGARMGRDIFHPNQPPALLPVFIERAMAAVYADHPDYDEAWRA